MRVTGGAFRSRAIRAPKGTATRPTSDRVREAIFSMLAADGILTPGARVLDLYAGSGSLAFEALSRGAIEAVLVEQGRDALAAIRDNARALGVEDRVRVVSARVERALSTLDGRFDVVFLDPPYADVRTTDFAAVLEMAGRRVTEGGGVVLEHGSGDEPPTAPALTLDRTRRYGDTAVSLFRISEG
jgi:16S rRNA (guanine(966)-N(2))-methyltransferase RsmD